MFVKPQAVNMWFTRSMNRNAYSRPDGVLVAAEKYIEQNGPEAFEKLISRVYLVLNSVGLESFLFGNKTNQLNVLQANGRTRSRRSSNYVSFDDDYCY